MSASERAQPMLAAIVAALAADPALAALVGARIYDAPPARAVMPSITVRSVSASDRGSADTDAQLLTVDCDVWDRYALGGDLSATRAAMGHIRRILHMQPVPVPGLSLIVLRCTGATGPSRDPDTVTLHGVVTLTALLGHEAAPAF